MNVRSWWESGNAHSYDISISKSSSNAHRHRQRKEVCKIYLTVIIYNPISILQVLDQADRKRLSSIRQKSLETFEFTEWQGLHLDSPCEVAILGNRWLKDRIKPTNAVPHVIAVVGEMESSTVPLLIWTGVADIRWALCRLQVHCTYSQELLQ